MFALFQDELEARKSLRAFCLQPKSELNKTPKVVSVGCVGPWKHNGVLSEFGKIRETGKMCHVMSIDE